MFNLLEEKKGSPPKTSSAGIKQRDSERHRQIDNTSPAQSPSNPDPAVNIMCNEMMSVDDIGKLVARVRKRFCVNAIILHKRMVVVRFGFDRSRSDGAVAHQCRRSSVVGSWGFESVRRLRI